MAKHSMSLILPPSELRAALDERALDRKHFTHLPQLAPCEPTSPARAGTSRRAFLTAAGAALAAFSFPRSVMAGDQLIFSPESAVADTPTPAATAAATMPSATMPPASTQQLRLGEIPRDFWQRPRSLRLKRQATGEYINVVYWKDGVLVPEGYWKICALMRDVRANMMTSMDPLMLDVLRGVLGYYEAWKWPHPLVVTSGYRTLATNNALSKEGAAKNSMHLYGKATDLYMPGVPAKDIGMLGLYMAQGGVGFYPGRGFTHLDTGRLRTWRG
jgi:uncharacterized protein YcbK (DUF882 family)